MKKSFFFAVWLMSALSIYAAAQTLLPPNAEIVTAQKILTAKELKEDFGVLKKALAEMHPGIYRYQTPQSMEKIFTELEEEIKRPLPESEFFKLLAQLANRLHCGHTFLNPYNQEESLRDRIFNRRAYLPFYFQIIDGKIIVTENAAPQPLSRGSEIKKINGFPSKKIIAALLSVANADGENTLAHRTQLIELRRFAAERFALFDWYFPLFFPPADDGETFAIEAVDFATKKRINFRVPALTKTERTAEIEKRYGKAPTYDDGWKFEIQDDKTGYLKIANSITWRLKRIKFKEFLSDVFTELRAKNIKILIIDVRDNDGGDSSIGFGLARYLARKNLPPYSASRRLVRSVAPQKDLAKYLATYSDELKQSLQNGLPEDFYRKVENDFFEILPNPNVMTYPPVAPAENNFQGTTYIISNASNASATFQFLNYVRENKLACIVGQETGGNRQGINGGNYFFLRLPNSRIEIDIPVYYFAPLTAQKDESVIPDIPVKKQPADIGDNFDREMSVIKRLIKSN